MQIIIVLLGDIYKARFLQCFLLAGFSFEKAVRLQPVQESIKPAVTRSVGISEAKTVATVLVEMEFDRYARFVPGINNIELTAEKKIINGDNIEHGRSILRHLMDSHGKTLSYALLEMEVDVYDKK